MRIYGTEKDGEIFRNRLTCINCRQNVFVIVYLQYVYVYASLQVYLCMRVSIPVYLCWYVCFRKDICVCLRLNACAHIRVCVPKNVCAHTIAYIYSPPTGIFRDSAHSPGGEPLPTRTRRVPRSPGSALPQVGASAGRGGAEGESHDARQERKPGPA